MSHFLFASFYNKVNYFLDPYFSPEALKAALFLALLSSWVLVGLFAYLNRYTHRHYFALWTVAWLFYTIWLTTTLLYLSIKNTAPWEWIRPASIGISAIYLFMGSLHFSGNQRGKKELRLMVCFVAAWSYVAQHYLKGFIWFSLPLFLILSLASFFTAGYFFQKRLNHRYIGVSMLGLGFILWGLQMAFYPFIEISHFLRPTGLVTASITQLVIAIGMVVLMLEEVRGETIALQDQVKTDARLMRKFQSEIGFSKNKYEHILEYTSDSVFTIDPRTLQILEINRAAQILAGYSSEELFQLRFVDLCAFLKEKEQVIANDPYQIQKIFSTYGNMSLQRKDNVLVTVEGSASVMTHATKGQTVQVFLREVTDRRYLEQQLQQAEKLSTLGQLISGVAHELNNPLSVINGYAQLLTMRPSVDEKIRADLLKIQHESERASKIVHNFLSFARKYPMEKAYVQLNDLIEATLELLDYDLRASGIRIERELSKNLPKVFADPNQMEQVFLNIINNATQAMEGISNEKILKIHTESTAPHVRVEIIDSGDGIPTALLNKIFDPFFSTKELGAGTGLGLSISHNIIKEHSGNIYAKNRPEGGAVFTIELPIAYTEKPQPNDTPSSSISGLFKKTFFPTATRPPFQVLVVDDETSIQEIFSELLKDRSCQVHGASTGLQAMKFIENQSLDLILCDLKMPGMDGQRLYEKTKEIKPEITKNFIFITGDTLSKKTSEFLQACNRRWIHKPFNFLEVEKLLREHFQKILDEENIASTKSSNI